MKRRALLDERQPPPVVVDILKSVNSISVTLNARAVVLLCEALHARKPPSERGRDGASRETERSMKSDTLREKEGNDEPFTENDAEVVVRICGESEMADVPCNGIDGLREAIYVAEKIKREEGHSPMIDIDPVGLARRTGML